MATYRKKKIDSSSSAADIWSRIKNAVAVAGCAEIRDDPTDPGGLVLITWLDEHVDWSQQTEIP